MKPKIRWELGQWWCGHIGGHTPDQAYKNWKRFLDNHYGHWQEFDETVRAPIEAQKALQRWINENNGNN